MTMMNLRIDSNLCVLSATDSRDHLFFKCSWSRSLLSAISDWLDMSYIPSSINSLCRCLGKPNKQTEVKWALAAVFGAATYYIWICRCKKFHSSLGWNMDQVLARVKEEISCYVEKFLLRRSKCNSCCLSIFIL